MIQAMSFYMFALITVASGILVVSARNPVHSVLWLILAFLNSAALFVLLGAELLAMIMIIVYVGAVAVLFLFVVMMLDINFAELRKGILQNLRFGALIGVIFVVELLLVLGTRAFGPETGTVAMAPAPAPGEMTNAEALGRLIYTNYVYLFQAAGMILLVAMIGAIVLTHRRREGVRRQKPRDQMRRSARDTIEVVEVKPGQGI